MAGSHRAQQQTSAAVPRRALVLAALVVLAVGVLIVVLVLDGGGTKGAEPKASPSVTPSTPTATPSVEPTPTPTPTPTPKPTARPTGPTLTTLATSVPRRLTAGTTLDAGFDDSIDDGTFTTRSTAELSRWADRGLPGSPGEDTVYVVGRIAADGDSGLGGLPALEPGDRISVRTDAGSLTYTVRMSQPRTTAAILGDKAFTAKSPGRLVLIGVRYDAAGNRTDDTVVVTAELSGASRR